MTGTCSRQTAACSRQTTACSRQACSSCGKLACSSELITLIYHKSVNSKGLHSLDILEILDALVFASVMDETCSSHIAVCSSSES